MKKQLHKKIFLTLVVFLKLASVSGQHVVNSDETWDSNAQYDDGIIITNCAEVVITNGAEIQIGHEKKIIVHPCSRLVIKNDAVVTSYPGSNNYWYGIEVWGDHTKSQLPRLGNGMPQYQGEVIVKNGGTIEHATTAIKAIKVTQSGYDWSKTGGIIKLEDAKLINNNNGIWLGGYTNFIPHNGNYLNNYSRINNSLFQTNDGFKFNAPYSFIGLSGAKGIFIRGNTFENIHTTLAPENRGRGIISFHSSFYVDHLCMDNHIPCSNYKKNRFEGLLYGVHASNMGGGGISSGNFVSIKNSEFIGCSKSIRLVAAPSPVIVNNILADMGPPVSHTSCILESPYAYGLYLLESTGYKVEENDFSATSYQGRVGIIPFYSGMATNEIYKNSFEDLYIGIAPHLMNHGDGNFSDGSSDFEGLRLFCNAFNDPSDQFVYDVRVGNAKDGSFADMDATIGQYQKMKNPDYDANDLESKEFLPAGNIFTERNLPPNFPPPFPPLDFKYEGNNVPHVYYYYEENTIEKQKPTYYSTSNITLMPYNHSNPCHSKTSSGGGLSPLYADLGDAQIALNSSTLILSIWKDGGNEDLPDEIATIKPWEVYENFNALMAESPYLSEDALIAIIENPSFDCLMVKLLMVANPHSKNCEEVMGALYDRVPPLPESYIDEILESDGDMQLKKLEGNVAADYHGVRMIGEDIKRHYRTDTTNTWAKDSLIAFASRQNTLMDRYELASIYLAYGQYNEMNTCLSNIPHEFELTDQQQDDHDNLITVFDIAEGMFSGETFIDPLEEDQITELEDMVYLYRPKLSSMALSLLQVNDPTYEYEEIVIFPEDNPENLSQPFRGFVKDRTKEDPVFKMYPNPANDYITVEYRTSSLEYEKLHIEFYNAQGAQVLSRVLEGGDSEELIGLTTLRSGTYIVKLFADNKLLDHKRLNLVR